jgi:hypothetical protein
MKNLAVIALCFLSSFASAKDIEEVTVKAKQVKIVLIKLSDIHKQNPITGNWYYVEEKKQKNKA